MPQTESELRHDL